MLRGIPYWGSSRLRNSPAALPYRGVMILAMIQPTGLSEIVGQGRTMSARDIIRTKLRRLRRGAQPRVLDLFAGCGGLSLGFQAAGFQIVGAVESDPLAAESHALSFHSNCTAEQRAAHAAPKDITRVEPSTLVRELGLGATASSVDVIIGGPPCQAFVRVAHIECYGRRTEKKGA